MELPFHKYQGAGNDFVIVQARHLTPSCDLPSLAQFLCDRRKGIGADGLLILAPSSIADYRMRIFNADGSEPAMCGNGAYCLADYIDRFLSPFTQLTLETSHTQIRCRKIGPEIALNLGPVSIRHFPLMIDSTSCYVVHTGVPHAVIWTQELDQLDVEKEGRALRFHPRFALDGVNVNFVTLTPSGQLRMRTYERGVEAETLSCGTGAAAVAFVARRLHQLPNPIPIATRLQFSPQKSSYEPQLRFFFSENTQQEIEVEMIGSAQAVFEGSVKLPAVKEIALQADS